VNELFNSLNNLSDYSKVGLSGKSSLTIKDKINSLYGIFIAHDILWLHIITGISMIIVFIFYFLKKDGFTKKQLQYFIFILLAFFVSVYTVFSPGNAFNHYAIFLFFTSFIIIAYCLQVLLNKYNSNFEKVIYSLLVFSFLYSKSYANEGFKKLAIELKHKFHNTFTERILAVTQPNKDRLLIWGWKNSYFVETKLLQGGRRMYPQFAIHNYRNKEIILNQYLEDLKKFKPKVILEIVGKGQFVFNDKAKHSIKNFPLINEYIFANYVLVDETDVEKMYILK
jgi:hypothetical protein